MFKGQGRANVLINKKLSAIYKEQFSKQIFRVDYRTIVKKEIFQPIILYSFSGYNQFFDQVVSILSFINQVGIPIKWIIISDGSHDEKQLKFFQSFPFVECKLWCEMVSEKYKEQIFDTPYWQVKKLFSFANISVDCCTILLDSDILFFEKFEKCLGSLLKRNNWYLSDLHPHFDDDFNYKTEQNYTNSGFIVLNSSISWEQGLRYILRRIEHGLSIAHFSEQTAVEIVTKQNLMSFLDPRLFLLELKDHFTYSSIYNYQELAMRHFVGPIRFRMWSVAKRFSFFLS